MRKLLGAIAIIGVVGAVPAEAQKVGPIGKAGTLAREAARAAKSKISKWIRRPSSPGGASDSFVAELKSPKTYCPLPRDGDEEKLIYAEFDKAAPDAVVIKQYSVPCKELPLFWQGQEPSRWSLYNVGKSTLPKDATRMAFVVEMSKSTGELKLGDLSTTLKEMAAEKAEERSGIIESTSDAVYVGTLSLEGNKKGAHVGGITILGNRVVGFNFFADFKSRKTFDELLADAKEAVTKSIEASDAKAKNNPNEVISPPRSTNRRPSPRTPAARSAAYRLNAMCAWQ